MNYDIYISILICMLRYSNATLMKSYRVSFELESGAVGQVTDFKEPNKKIEWGLKKVISSLKF